METVTIRELTCIGCPMGCPLTVTMEAGEVISVTGNTCKRGDIYARKEVTNPTRIVTSTVRVTGGDADMVSVKTSWDIIFEKLLCGDRIVFYPKKFFIVVKNILPH